MSEVVSQVSVSPRKDRLREINRLWMYESLLQTERAFQRAPERGTGVAGFKGIVLRLIVLLAFL